MVVFLSLVTYMRGKSPNTVSLLWNVDAFQVRNTVQPNYELLYIYSMFLFLFPIMSDQAEISLFVLFSSVLWPFIQWVLMQCIYHSTLLMSGFLFGYSTDSCGSSWCSLMTYFLYIKYKHSLYHVLSLNQRQINAHIINTVCRPSCYAICELAFLDMFTTLITIMIFMLAWRCNCKEECVCVVTCVSLIIVCAHTVQTEYVSVQSVQSELFLIFDPAAAWIQSQLSELYMDKAKKSCYIGSDAFPNIFFL